jgi:hypothetical protein
MAIPEPLRRYLRLQRQYDAKIMAILERSANDLRRRISALSSSVRFSDTVRTSQLRLVLSQIRRTQLEMFLSIGDEIRAGQLAAAIFATQDLEKLAKVAFASLDQRAANAFIDSLMGTANAGIKNLYTRTKRELSERLYKNGRWSTDHIETLIQEAIVRGASARELAKDVYKFVSPTAPGGASHVAMRLARTEINNAFHNQQIAGFTGPWVESVKWNLSGSHPRKDECNRLAESDQYNLGPGQFPRGKVPGKPHPQCLCFLTATAASPRKFADDVRAGKYDDELRRRFDANVALLKGEGAPVVKKVVAPTAVKKTTTARKAAPIVKKDAVKKTTVKKTTKAAPPKEVPVPRSAQPYHTSIKGIEDLAETVEKSAIKSVQTLTGGVSAETELVTFANGTKLVRKSAGNPGAEHAASVIGRALDTKAPRVYRNHPSGVYMDYVSDAKTAAELQVRANKAGNLPELRKEHFALAESDDGLRVGLFDLLIRNGDRNTGNWMVSNSGRIVPIDHGHARPNILGDRAMPLLSASGPFAEQIFIGISKNHKFTTADIDWARGRIEAVGPQLIHMGERKFLDYALATLDKLRPFAKGTRNILVGE